MSEELTQLAMPDARLTVEVRSTRSTPATASLKVGERGCGSARPAWTRSSSCWLPTPAPTPRPLAKGASGGELSRVMLAIEVALAGTSPVPTFVFDEVDAGVGGRAAVEVGRRLAELARTAQVLVVTHLPQVAAYADRHVVVEKSSDGTVTTSGLTVLDDGGRERELSRMFAGMDESDTALAHARELLESAAPSRALALRTAGAGAGTGRSRLTAWAGMKTSTRPSRRRPAEPLPGVHGTARVDRRIATSAASPAPRRRRGPRRPRPRQDHRPGAG